MRTDIIYANTCMLVSTAIISWSLPIGAKVLEFLKPSEIQFFRFLIAFFFLLGLAIGHSLFGKKFNRQHISWKPQWSYLGIGLLYSLFFIGTFEALKYTSSFNISLFYTLLPCLTLILGQNHKNHLLKLLPPLVVSLLASTYIITEKGVMDFQSLNKGDLIYLASLSCMAGYFLLSKKYLKDQNPLASTTWILGISAMVSISYLLISTGKLSGHYLHHKALFGILYLSLASTVGSFFAIQFAIKRLDAIEVASFSYLSPTMVIVYEWLFSERHYLSLATSLAILLTLACVMYLQVLSKKFKP